MRITFHDSEWRHRSPLFEDAELHFSHPLLMLIDIISNFHYKHPLNSLLQSIITLIFPKGNFLEMEFQGPGLHSFKLLAVYIAKLPLRKTSQSPLLSAVRV